MTARLEQNEKPTAGSGAKLRVLVTDANTNKALAIVRAVGTSMEVMTASNSRIGPAAWSRYSKKHFCYPGPRFRPVGDSGSVGFAPPGNFAQWILDTCKKDEINVVICPEDQSSYLLSQEIELFLGNGIVVLTPPRTTLLQTMDKAATIQAAQEVDVPVPKTKNVNDPKEAIAAAQELGYPVVIKPRFSHYWNGSSFIVTPGTAYANSDKELILALQKMPPGLPMPLLQEFIPGRGVGIMLLLGQDGSVCAEFAHERLRELRPSGSGSVLRRSIAIDPVLMQWSLNLLRHINWHGVAMVEYKQDERDGRFCLMEINGRFWGSLQLAIDAGVNFPELLVREALGEPVKKPSYVEGVISRWWLGDLQRVGIVLRGQHYGFPGTFPSRLSGILSFWGPQPPGTRNEVFRWNDPWPALGELLFLLRRVLAG